MTTKHASRDPGLQPERTVLSWLRTSFSVLILALAATRSGFSRGDLASEGLGIVATLLALILVFVCYLRQRKALIGITSTTSSSILVKWLLSGVLSLAAFSLSLPNLCSLLQEG